MQESDDIKQLLVDIRDLQREHLAEYRRVTHQSLELQRRSVLRQEQLGTLYRRVVLVGIALTVFVVVVILVLLRRVLP